jgi:glycine betaine/proline transport system permease protein
MPSFVYLIPAMMLFGLGKVPAVFATVIYAVPPIIRLTDVGIRGVPESVVEAARSFGASDRQLLFDVQLPLAFPSIMVGVNQTTMMSLAMVVIASMIGARGLGLEVLVAINRIEIGHGFTAGISIVFLAIVIDRITNAFALKQQKHLSL